jgi:hypothetical protein
VESQKVFRQSVFFHKRPVNKAKHSLLLAIGSSERALGDGGQRVWGMEVSKRGEWRSGTVGNRGQKCGE